MAQYNTRPVAIDIALNEAEHGRLALPAITICNMNQVRRSVLCGNDTDMEQAPGADFWRKRLCQGRPIENVWMSEEVLEEVRNFTEWVMKTQRFNNTLGRRMGHQRMDLFRECSFGTLDCRNETYVRKGRLGQ
ncbi:hypothetical protein HPB48_000846 [Haemaphysalis longicornis]|uniref:Uncharacterized protein n=1 Tax=Haemaphysalis longicornis TaxID=44386 RepID=A0A9J6FT90_HAELO|nr:hypothetical protein HPB48_000846 [Haemaphysalis longicornis]